MLQRAAARGELSVAGDSHAGVLRPTHNDRSVMDGAPELSGRGTARAVSGRVRQGDRIAVQGIADEETVAGCAFVRIADGEWAARPGYYRELAGHAARGKDLRVLLKVTKDDGKLRAVMYSLDQGGSQSTRRRLRRMVRR